MAWGLLEDEDRLSLDPALMDFVRQRTGQGLPTPEADPSLAVPTSTQDEEDRQAAIKALGELVKRDEKTKTVGHIAGLLSDSAAMMRGKDRPFRPPPQVDPQLKQFVADFALGKYGKKGAAAGKEADPADARLKELRAKLLEKQIAGQPKSTPFADGPPTEEQRAELKRLGRNPDAYPTAGWAQQAIIAGQAAVAAQTATANKEKTQAEKEAEKAGKESQSKRYLGEYFTPAAQDLDPGVRSDFLLTRATPGAEVMDKLAGIHGLLDSVNGVPGPQKMRDLHQLISSTLTKYNKTAGLGALSGPDKEILEKAMGSVDSLSGILGNTSGLLDLKRSIKNAAEILSKEATAAAGSYGSTPKPGSPFDLDVWNKKALEAASKYRSSGGAPAPVEVKTKSERDALPVGTAYTRPGDSQVYVKR